jgi:hypothetical protein
MKASQWVTPKYVDLIYDRYSATLSGARPTWGPMRVWRSFAYGGVFDMDIHFSQPRQGDQHVKLLVDVATRDGRLAVVAGLYDWLGPEWVEIGHWEGLLEGAGGSCRIVDRPAPPPPPPSRRRPQVWDDEEVPV